MNNVDQAKRYIKNLHPWIGRVLENLPITYSDTLPDGSPQPSMATNGKELYISTEFADTLSQLELRGVLVHEAVHVIQRHPLRRGDRDPQLYGIAIDAATNAIVLDLGYSLPEDRIAEIRGQSVEQIYAQLAKDSPPESQQPAGSSGDSDSEDDSQGGESGSGDSEGGTTPQSGGTPKDDVMDYPLEPGQTMAEAEREIDKLMAETKMSAQMAGKDIGRDERMVFKRQDSDLNWPRELEEYIHLIGGADYSMNPPHIGLGQQGIICNQLNPTGCGNVVLAVDTSGSIDEDKLNLALSHLMLFVENIDYESLRVIACQSRVTYDRLFSRGETVDISDMPVGGGTRFMPLFDIADDNGAPNLLIYFTDMCVDDAREMPDPGYPIVWLVDRDCAIDPATGEWTDYAYYQPDFGKRIDANR